MSYLKEILHGLERALVLLIYGELPTHAILFLPDFFLNSPEI